MTLSDFPALFVDGGETGRLIARRDWSGTPLGPAEAWPQSLKTILGFLLRSPVAMVMLWGEDGVMLYNDAYSVFAGGRHPGLLGAKVREGWPEVAEFNDNVMRVGLAGGTLAYRDQELTLYRHGHAEQVWMDLDYSPVLDDNDKPAGVMAIVVETTERVLERQKRELADQRLTESDGRFRNMADNAPMMMWVTDPSGHCTYLNQRWYDFTGQTEGEAEGYGWLDPTHPDDKPFAEDAFLTANANRSPFRVEYRLRHKSGRYRWVIDAASPRFDAAGDYLGYVGSVVDIQERREAEERLRQSEGRFRAAFDAVAGILWTNDASGRMSGDQPGWQRLTGQDREHYEGYGWSEAVHPEDAEPTLRAWQQAVSERRTFVFEHRVRGGDGQYRLYDIRAIPVFDANGDIVEWVGVHTDITRQRADEERLKRSEAAAREERDRAQSYLQVAEVMLLVLDANGVIQTINRRGAEILGYDSPEHLIGRSWSQIAVANSPGVPDSRAEFARLMAGDGEEVTSYENRVRTAQGAERLIAWRTTVLRDLDKRIIGTLSSGEDVTEQREAEARERLLAQEVDHRAKNLLAIVQSVVQLTRGQDIGEFKASVTGRIQSLARTHGLLAAARWEGADLRQLVADELAPYARDDSGSVRIEGRTLHLTPSAAQALALVIHELATNAAKYGALSTLSGHVHIVWREEHGQIVLTWHEIGGPPVSPPSRRGFGSIVLQSSVERQLRGSVALDWQPEGLLCTLTLPCLEVLGQGRGRSVSQVKPADAAAPRQGPSGSSILVLEDEALIAAQIEDVLAQAGYAVIGPAARVTDAFDNFYAEAPDAAVLDVNVAGERSFPFAELLKAKDVPFALCTGYGEATVIPEALRSAPVIVKPFNPAELLRVVAKLLE